MMATMGKFDVTYCRGLESSVARSAKAVLFITIAAVSLSMQAPLRAQWWSRAPADYEECADRAENISVKEQRTSALSACHSQFAGRRKPGGGYSYFDFMQNRSFDIAGPNPTPEEQRYIDEQYTAFLDRERQSSITAAFNAKQLQAQQVSLQQQAATAPVPMPRPAPAMRTPMAGLKPQPKITGCAKHSFSCEWPRVAEGIKDLKKLFGAAQAKAWRD